MNKIEHINAAKKPATNGGATLRVMVDGRIVDLTQIRPEDISLRVIAEHLAKINRFSGGTFPAPYSVAQHCIEVAKAMPAPWRVYGLLHDAHEAYTGDITSPMQNAIHDTGAKDRIKQIQNQIDRAIYAALGLHPPTPEIMKAVKLADATACNSEIRDLIPSAAEDVYAAGPLFKYRIRPQTWDEAHENYLRELEKCGLDTSATIASPGELIA